jgi:hypothetical protein
LEEDSRTSSLADILHHLSIEKSSRHFDDYLLAMCSSYRNKGALIVVVHFAIYHADDAAINKKDSRLHCDHNFDSPWIFPTACASKPTFHSHL